MDKEKLDYMEHALRECFKHHLSTLNVDGVNDCDTVRTVKTYGVLWHVVHQLQMAENNEQAQRGSMTTAQTMNVQATGFKMGVTK